MIKTIWSNDKSICVAFDDKDIMNQSSGISEANAKARVKHYAIERGFPIRKDSLKIK